METILSILAIFLILGGFILLAIKGKMNWASSLGLLLKALSPMAIGLLLIYALPTEPNIKVIGPIIPIIPLTISVVMLFFIIFTISKPKIEPRELPESQSNIRFIFLTIGILIQLSAIVLTIIAFYAPNVIGISRPSPILGIIGYFILNILSAIVFYLSSRKNTINRPNLMRWIVFFLIISFIDNALVISLILIYASGVQQTIYPFWAGINAISYLPYSILMIFLSRGYIYSKP